jgi:hypothetical protein
MEVWTVTTVDALAEQISAAYRSADLTAFGSLLADDVRWGDDDHPNRCRSRGDVLRTFAGWMDSGVTADLVDVTTGPLGVACRLHVTWVDPQDRQRGVDFFHVFMVSDGLVREIRRYDDKRSAESAIATS